MGPMSGVVVQLKKALGKAEQEVQRFTAALAALGSSNSNGRRNLSAAARKRISLAQKKRWAKAKVTRRNPSGRCQHQPVGRSRRHKSCDGRR